MIKGLTGKCYFPQIGTLRKGAQKTTNAPGRDLEYFRFDCDDKEVVDQFKEIYGEEPQQIRVYLPYPTIDENFEAWQEEWNASSLLHRCDGEFCVLWHEGGVYCTPENTGKVKPCPGKCKPSGRLKVILPDLKRMAFVMAMTTSKHDIMSIDAHLRALQQTSGKLSGIPLILRRVARKISTPDWKGGDKRVRSEKYLLTIEAQPEWVELQLSAMAQGALPGGIQRQIGTSLTDSIITSIEREMERQEAPLRKPNTGNDDDGMNWGKVANGYHASNQPPEVASVIEAEPVTENPIPNTYPTAEDLPNTDARQAEAARMRAQMAQAGIQGDLAKEMAVPFFQGLAGCDSKAATLEQLIDANLKLENALGYAPFIEWTGAKWYGSLARKGYLLGLIAAVLHQEGEATLKGITGDAPNTFNPDRQETLLRNLESFLHVEASAAT